MSEWTRKVGAMTLLVADLSEAKQFYQTAFGLAVMYEDAETVMFQFTDVYVFLHQAAGASHAPADDVLDLARTGAGQFAIIVDDVDAVSADLAAVGVELLSGPSDRAWGMRTITFADPGGHVWEIAQEIPGS